MKSIKKKIHLLLLSILISSTIISCSFVTDDENRIDPAIHPDLSLYNTNYRIGRSDGNPFIIEADLIDIYEKNNNAIGEGISFTRYSDDGSIDISGTCDSIDINTKDENAILNGNVLLNIETNGLFIKSSQVSWTSDTSILDTGSGNVTVEWDNGNTINGTGFTANLNTRVFELGKINNGIINEKN